MVGRVIIVVLMIVRVVIGRACGRLRCSTMSWFGSGGASASAGGCRRRC